MIYDGTLNAIPLNAKVCNSCTIYIVLIVIFVMLSISISSVFFYFHWYLRKIIFVLSLSLILKQLFNKYINGKYQRSKY